MAQNLQILKNEGPGCPRPQQKTASLRGNPARLDLCKRHAMRAGVRRSACLIVVVLSQEPSHDESDTREMLDVEVQVLDALLCMSTNNFHLNSPQTQPFGLSFATGAICTERVTILLLSVRPRPCDIDLREVHLRAQTAQSLRLSFNMKKRLHLAGTPWDVDQGVLTSQHQIESLSMYVLHVWVAGAMCNGAFVRLEERIRRVHEREVDCIVVHMHHVKHHVHHHHRLVSRKI